jgi:hypothetical protein
LFRSFRPLYKGRIKPIRSQRLRGALEEAGHEHARHRADVFFIYAGAACSRYAIGDRADRIGPPLAFAALTLVSSALWEGSRHDANAHQVRE